MTPTNTKDARPRWLWPLVMRARFFCGIKWLHLGRYTVQWHVPSWSLGRDGDWYIRAVTIARAFRNPDGTVGAGLVVLGFGAAVVRKSLPSHNAELTDANPKKGQSHER